MSTLAGAKEISDTTATIPHPYPLAVAEQWIALHPAAWTERKSLALAITQPADGALLGAVGLTFAEENQSAELGYWIGLPYWGRGLATEAAAALTDFGFKVIGLNRIHARYMARNAASGRVLLKIGMKREGVSPRALLKQGRFEDLVFCGVLRRDWPGADSAPPPAPG